VRDETFGERRDQRLLAGLPRGTAYVYALLCLLALIAYGMVWRDAPVIAGDSPSYLAVARDLSDLQLERVHDRSPGYPLFLVGLGSSERPTRVLFFATLLLHLGSIWLLGIVLFQAGAGERWLKLLCLGLILPPYAESSAYVMTETLAQFTLVVGFTALMFWISRRRAWWLVLSGVALGYAALTRPAYQALAPALAVILCLIPLVTRPSFTIRDALRAGVGLAVIAVGMLGIYAVVNGSATGYFGITPMLGFNLSTRTVSVIERLPDEYADAREIMIRARDAQLVRSGSSHTGYSYIHEARPQLAELTGLDTPQLSAYTLRLNLLLIRAAPLQYLEEVAKAVGPYWFPSARELAIMSSRRIQLLWVALHFAIVLIFALQFIVMTGMGLHQITRWLIGAELPRSAVERDLFRASAYVIATVIVIYTMVLSCMVDVGDTRQRVPTDVFILFLTLLGVHWWWLTARRAVAQRSAGISPVEAGGSETTVMVG